MKKDALRPGTGKEYTRGLSKSDYNIARKLINDGLVTEQELIDAGKMLPSKGKGRRGTGAREWFLEARKTKRKPETIRFVMEPDDISDEVIEQSKQIIVDCTQEEGEEVQFWNAGKTFTMHKEEK